MSEWPSIAWTARRSAPPDSRWLANEWPSVWGKIRSPIQAASAQRRIRFHRVCRVIAVPRRERNRALVVRLPRKPCRAPVMYSERAARAASATGTTRSLPPFPSTYRNPAFPSTFSSRRVTTSDARSPGEGEVFRQGAADPGRLDVGDGACGEDPLAHEEPEEGAHRGDVPGGGTGREPLVPQRREVFEEVGARKRLRVEPPVREEGGEAADVRAVRRQRVLRKAPLRFQVEEEGLEEGVVVHHSPSGGRGISTIRGSIVARSTIAHVYFPFRRPHDSPGFNTSALPTCIVSGRWVWPKRTRSNRPCPFSSPCSWS